MESVENHRKLLEKKVTYGYDEAVQQLKAAQQQWVTVLDFSSWYEWRPAEAFDNPRAPKNTDSLIEKMCPDVWASASLMSFFVS